MNRDEVGWLIKDEHGPGWLGCCEGRMKWTTPCMALRFSRQEDAKNTAILLGLSSVLFEEHAWMEVNNGE